MKITKLDVAVAVLAGLTCLTMKFGLPVWALFIGWAWYFALGTKSIAFKQAIPALFLGYLLAAIAIIIYTASGHQMIVLMIAVGITVFLLMLSIKARSVDVREKPKNVYKEQVKIIEDSGYFVQEVVELDPFEKDHAIVLASSV